MAGMTIQLFNDNTEATINASVEMIQLALQAIGEEAETFAKANCPVDTGLLRNSINYKTADAKGSGDSKPYGNPPKKVLVVGTNVEYAPYQEFNDAYSHTTGRAHFLRDSIAGHTDFYKKILEAALSDT